MYVCIYIRMYVCMYENKMKVLSKESMYVYMHACMYMRLLLIEQARAKKLIVYVYTYIHVCTHVYIEGPGFG